MTIKLVETTIRDFGGGWDVSDSDKSLGSKYQPISDNVIRETDGSFSIRPGYKLYADLKQGTETVVAEAAYTVNSTISTGVLKITKTAHGYTSGNHVTITSWSATIAGITSADILGTHGIKVVDANNFSIYVRKAATSTTSASITIGWTVDTHLMGGRDIYGRYFKDHIIVFTDIGEVYAVDNVGVGTAVWNFNIANSAVPSVEPWGPCQRISAEIVRGHLLAVNGATNDKPLDIIASLTGVVSAYYLLNDAAPPSNSTIPRADFIIAADRYVLLISTEFGPTKVDISAKDTYFTFSRDPAPDDAVEIDLGMVTQSVETTILGANTIRSKVFIAFHDRSQLGELGTYTTATVPVHEPDFKDNVAMLGSYAHHSIISLGNDLFCAAINGINSLEISKQSGEYTPTTISDLIHPVMLRHMGRLTEADRRFRTFAVWDSNARAYMLFMPKYSDLTYDLPDDPIVASSILQQNSLVYVQFPSHTFDAGDYVTIAGITGSPDTLISAAKINGTRRIRAVVDDNTLVVEVDAYPAGLNYSFGGINGTIKPVNDETPCYVYEYNSRMKIRRWTRFRGLNFDWGTVSQLSNLYFGKSGRIYRWGNASNKFTGDKLGDYTKRVWANSTTYAIGDRILDSTYKQVFIVMVDHVTSSSGTFKQARDANPTWYADFTGLPINWELESSWTDFKERKVNKQIEIVSFDTSGSSEFEFSIYTNSIRTDFETFARIPNRTTYFVGEDGPGFGAGPQPYGGGRNTRQESLRGMPVYGKMFRLRFAGSSIKPLTVSAATMYYHKLPGALT